VLIRVISGAVTVVCDDCPATEFTVPRDAHARSTVAVELVSRGWLTHPTADRHTCPDCLTSLPPGTPVTSITLTVPSTPVTSRPHPRRTT